MGFSTAALPFTVRSFFLFFMGYRTVVYSFQAKEPVRSSSMLPLLPASLVDLNNGESLFGEKEQARLLAGEQLPCMLLVLLDQLTLFSLARWYGTRLGCALCKLAGWNGVVAVCVAFTVTALV